MPNGMETKLREWRRYQTKYPNLRSISNPYNAKGDLTLEAKVAWDNKTEAVPAAPTPAPVPTAQTAPIPVSPDQDPDQRSWLGMGLPSPVWKAWDFFVPTREAREGRAPVPFEKYLLGRDTPWEPRLSMRFYMDRLPKWAGVEAASGVASLLEQPWAGGSPPTPEQVAERAQLDAQLQKESGEGTFRDYLERRIQKGELKAKDLNPAVRFGAEILPTLLADIAVTKGRGTVGLVSKLRPPVKVGGVELPGAVVHQPGIPAALRRTAATALEPVAATEELATKALGPTLRAITGTRTPAALRALEAGAVREAPGVVPAAARTPTRQAAPDGSEPIEIGDEVLFSGRDGDISAKVIGKGVTEIEGISKSHLHIKYDTPSGIKSGFIEEGLVRPLTTPSVRQAAPTAGEIQLKSFEARSAALATKVKEFEAANPGKKFWYHGGDEIDETVSTSGMIESGWLTPDLDEALMYAEGFVHLVDDVAVKSAVKSGILSREGIHRIIDEPIPLTRSFQADAGVSREIPFTKETLDSQERMRRLVTAERFAARTADVAPEIPIDTGIPTPSMGIVAPAVKESLRKASQQRKELDAPGFFSRFLEEIPGIKKAQRWFRPAANEVPERIQVAYVAQSNEKSYLLTKMFASRQNIFKEAERLFGVGVVDDELTKVAWIGMPKDKRKINNSLFDVAQRPHLYDLSVEQKEFLNEWQRHNSQFMRELTESYGAKVKEYPAPKGGVFLSNVDVSEEVMEALDASEIMLAKMGRGKTRIFQTAADRMAEKSTFKPLTNIGKLQTAMDEWKASAASREVFKQGSGGLTHVQAVDLKHPGYRQRRDNLAQKIQNLKARINTASRQEKQITTQIGRTSTQARQARRRAEPMLKRLEELNVDGPEYGPEFSYLSGQTRELLMLAQQAEKRGLSLALRVGERRGKAKTMIDELNDITPQLEKLRHDYKGKNITPLKLVEGNLFRYFPAAEAKVVEELQKTSSAPIVKILDDWRGTAFGGDVSPLFGIQIPLGFIFDPKLGIQRLVGGIKGTVRNKDPRYMFKFNTLAEEVAEDVTGWQEFAYWTGLPIRGDTPQEFAGGLLRHIDFQPRVGNRRIGPRINYTKFNEAMFRMVLKQTKAYYDKQISILAKEGITGDSAKMAAADLATMVYPMWNPNRIGLSSSRAATIRSLPTSVSFLIRPAAFMAKASTGFVKLAAGEALTPTERLALRSALVGAATAMSLSISSSVISAIGRGRDPWDATLDVIDPSSSKFASIVIGTRHIPLGGPFRSMIKMIAPRDVDWSPVPVPFATIYNFVRNRVGPGLKTQWDWVANKDYYGNKIREGDLPEVILRSLLYEVEGLAPLTIGSTISGVRRDIPGGEIGVESFGQFLGGRIDVEGARKQRSVLGEKLAQEAQEPSRVPGPPDERGALEKAWNIAWPSPGAREAREGLAPQGTYDDIAVAKGYKIPTSGLFAVDPAVLRDSPQQYWQYDRATRNLIEKNPEYKELTLKAEEEIKRWNPALGEYKEKERERTNTLREQLEGIAKESRDKDYRRPMAWYKTRVKLILHVYYHDREKAREEAKKKGILGKDRDPDGPFQQAEDIYYRLLFTDDKDLLTKIFGGGEYALIEDPNTGEFNWDEREERLNYLITTYGENFVRDMKEASLANLPPVEVKRRKDIDFIESTGYWDAEKILAKHYGVEEAHKEYVRLKRKNVPKSEEFLKNQAPAGLRLAVKYTRRTRLQMRKNNSRLDEILLYNGYAKTPALEQ